MPRSPLLALILWICCQAGTGWAGEVLVVRIGALGTAPQTAAAALGHSVTIANSESEFFAAIFTTSGDLALFDLLIVDMPVGNLGSDACTTIVDYLDAGGKAILAYAELDSNNSDGAILRPAFDIAATTSHSIPLDIVFPQPVHPIGLVPHALPAMIPWVADPHIDDGDILTAAAGAVSVATFSLPSSPPSSIVLSADGSTLCNGFSFDSYDPITMGQLLENEITALLGSPPTPVTFVRGDCNGDGSPNLADVITLLGAVFPVGPPPTLACLDACDMNDDGSVNVADAVRGLAALFGMATVPLPGPIGACGDDPSAGDGLDCASYSNCP